MKKFLAILLCVCMMASLCVVANADPASAVAEIGTVQYNTLPAAIEAAASSATKTITLLSDIVITQNTTYDFTGLTVETGGHKFDVKSGALTIAGSGTVNDSVKGTSANRMGMFYVEQGASLTIENGTYTSMAAEIVKTLGTATVNNGTFTCNGNTASEYDGWCIMVAQGKDARLTVEAGTLTATSGTDYCGMNGVYALNGATIVLGKTDGTGPSITTDYSAIGANNTTATCSYTIYGGTYTIDNAGSGTIGSVGNKFNTIVYMSCEGVYNISGGTFTTTTGTLSHIFSIPYTKPDITLNITGGSFSSTGDLFYIGTDPTDSVKGTGSNTGDHMSISGGKFAENVKDDLAASNLVAPGYFVVPNTGSDAAAYPYTVSSTGAAAIGTAQYASVQAAVNAAGTTAATVTMERDSAEDVVIQSSANITLDLNGRVLTGATANASGWGNLATQNSHTALVNKGTLTIVDSSAGKTGRVTAAGENASALYNDVGATATLNGGTFTTNTASGALTTTQQDNMYVIRNHGTMTMNDGVTVTTGGAYQLSTNTMITNGYEQNERASGDENVYHLAKPAEMTINGGSYSGAIFVVKNGDWSGKLTINGGTFTNIGTTGGTVMHYGAVLSNSNNCTATVNNGTFIGYTNGLDPVIKVKDKLAVSEGTGLTIKGGTFSINSSSGDVIDAFAKTGAAAPILNIEGGNFTGTFTNNGENKAGYSIATSVISVSGGYFTADPSAYLVANKVAVTSDMSGYNYMVAARAANAAKVAAADPVVENPAAQSGTDAEKKAAADLGNAIANPQASTPPSIDQGAAGAAANTVANSNTTTPAQGAAALTNAGINGATAKNTKIVIQTYLDITIENVAKNGGTTTVTLDITPMYQKVATTASDPTAPDAIKLNTDGKNAVVLESAQRLTVTKPVMVTIPLSADFPAGTLYVRHQLASGKFRTYQGTVDDNHVLTFYNPDGFSMFTLTSANTSSAEVNGVGYDTLQEAVDAVQNGQTVKVLKDNESAVVSRTVSFTLDKNGKNGTSITAGPNTVLAPVSNNVYSFTSSSPAYPGGTGSSTETKTYTVTAAPAVNGTLSPAGKTTVKSGESLTYTIKPADGCKIADVLVDGKSVGAVSTYTFDKVSADHTISAVFEKADAAGEWVNPFTDVAADAWYYDSVKYVNQHGMFSGSTPTTFSPNDPITRQQMWMVIARMSGASPANYAEARAWAMANKISDGTNPGSVITREQFAAMLYRYAQLKGYDTTQGGMAVREFADYSSISAYALAPMTWAVNAGLLQGSGNKLMPKNNTTRAQSAAILMRFCENIVK